MSEFVVAVYREGKGFRVEPGRLLVRKGDTAIIFSVDAGPITVFLPATISGESRGVQLTVAPMHPCGFTVPPSASARCYEYAVHVDEERVFAEGGSQPKIIVLE